MLSQEAEHRDINMTKAYQLAYTLIELMITLAIVAVLTAVALPAYQDYAEKAKFAEVLSFSDGYTTAVGVCIAQLGKKEGCNEGTNGIGSLNVTADYVDSAVINNGAIEVTATDSAGGFTSILTPTLTSGSITWAQTGTCVGVGYCTD